MENNAVGDNHMTATYVGKITTVGGKHMAATYVRTLFKGKACEEHTPVNTPVTNFEFSLKKNYV